MLHASKNTAEHNVAGKDSLRRGAAIYYSKLFWAAVASVLLLGSSTYYGGEVGLTKNNAMKLWNMSFTKDEQQLVRKYHLQTGSRWMNPGVHSICPDR
jgi:hypothetical protein